MCGYALTVNTPLACDRTKEKYLLQRLTDMNVFGFSDGNKGSKKRRAEVSEEIEVSPS